MWAAFRGRIGHGHFRVPADGVDLKTEGFFYSNLQYISWNLQQEKSSTKTKLPSELDKNKMKSAQV